jgi:hypothetical protein
MHTEEGVHFFCYNRYMKYTIGWVIGLLSILWLSSDPMAVSIHPTTGVVNVYGKGVVELCAKEFVITTCFTVSLRGE